MTPAQRITRWLGTASLLGILLLQQACDSHDEHEGHSHGESDNAAGVHENDTASYNETQGLKLSPESLRVLKIRHATASIQSLRIDIPLILHIYAITPEVLSVVEVSKETAALANTRPELDPVGESKMRASLVHEKDSPSGKKELVYRLQNISGQAKVGSTVDFLLPHTREKALIIPKSAILDSATGPQVFLVQGEFFKRTEVIIGIQNDRFVEVLSGLKPGDIVAANAVDQLYLTELRLTKGGGHTH